ncbi:MAG TPA: PAS domain S-box protein [Armatimonadota bacterium]|nr:PAS domain S-box protein [Armatimonadota bacterium]
MPERLCLVIAIALQILAALRAIHLMRLTRNRLAWGMISGALLLLALRMVMDLLPRQYAYLEFSSNLLVALGILVTSLLLLAGLYYISPILTSYQRSEQARQESETRYRTLINSMQEGVALHEIITGEEGTPVDYRILAVNPAFTAITGFTSETAEGALASELYGTGAAPYLAEYARALETHDPVTFETFFAPMDKHLNISVFSPAPGQFATIVEDITERVKSEEALRFAQFALDRASDAMFLIDAGARVVYVNDAACAILGYSRDALLAMRVQDFEGDFVPETWAARWEAFTAGGALTYESRYRTRDGRMIPVEITGNFLRYQAREYVCGFVRDITERKQVEAELRTSEERFRTSVDTMLDAFGIFSAVRDREGRITDFRIEYLNAAACALNGIAQDAALERHFSDVISAQRDRALFPDYCQVVDTGEPLILLSYVDPGDVARRVAPRVFDIQAVKLHDGFIVSWRDVTERHRFQEQLYAETERLAITLRSIGDGVITTDRDGRVVLMNRVAEELTGWTQQEADSRPLTEVFRIIDEYSGERCESPVDQVLQSGTIVGLNSHTVLVSRHGAEYILNDSGAPITDPGGEIVGVVLVFRDVTEKRWLEAELQRAAKLESLGILAGGIAHDFNNVLTAILGNLSLARVLAAPSDAVYPKLQEAEKAALHAKALTQQILTFSRGGTPVKRIISLAELLRETVAFALPGSSVACDLAIADDLWPAEVDPGQVTQVIHNLVVNADQATSFGGSVCVRACNCVVPRGDMLPLDPGSYVRIEVEDQGIGIEPEDLPKIFDPFFSTKPDGSGLGLATAYSIVRNHHGYITVESEVDIGTTFTVYLPAAPGAVVPQPVTEAAVPVISFGRILVMDDEPLVLETVESMLEVLGYEVVGVTDGEAAIAEYDEALRTGMPFDAVLLDLTMRGGIGGQEVMARLRQVDPRVRAIVSSGYSNDPIMADCREYGFRTGIAKPYKVSELSDVVRRVIAERDDPVAEG